MILDSEFAQLDSFVLVGGNARSGSSLIGFILNAHPNVVLANESRASGSFWKRLDRNQILRSVQYNSTIKHQNGSPSGGYYYAIDQPLTEKSDMRVMGDKIWNPATLLLHGNYTLITDLEGKLDTRIRFVHAVRNPFDVIATMHKRSGAPVKDRTRWYFMHAEAICSIQERMEDEYFIHVHHEDLIHSPDEVISGLITFLQLQTNPDYLYSCRTLVFDKPKSTRELISWKREEIEEIADRAAKYSFLQRYLQKSLIPDIS